MAIGLAFVPDAVATGFSIYTAATTAQPHDQKVSIPITRQPAPGTLSAAAIHTFFKGELLNRMPPQAQPQMAGLPQQIIAQLAVPQNHSAEVTAVINALFWKLYPVPEAILQEKNSSLWLWVCPLTKKPIRYAVKPAGDSQGIWYERAVLDQWMAEHPNERPVDWPEASPYQPGAYLEDSSIQFSIDATLRKIACRELNRYYTPKSNRQKQERLEVELTRKLREPTEEEILYRIPISEQIKQAFQDCHGLSNSEDEDCFTRFLSSVEADL